MKHNYVSVGKILNFHGIKGDAKVGFSKNQQDFLASLDYVLIKKDNEWINMNGDVNEEGILIGGCIDVLKDLIGTKFDKTNEFLEKYKDEGFIWYFDVFSMTSEALYNTLLQFKYAGWFKYTKAILIGKVCIPNTFVDMTYEELIKKAIQDIPVVYKFDVGHVKPSFTMINGMKVRIISDKNEGSLEYIN